MRDAISKVMSRKAEEEGCNIARNLAKIKTIFFLIQGPIVFVQKCFSLLFLVKSF